MRLNKLNGVFASENPHTLTEILRDEWGFDGYVMSDWGAVNDRVKGLAAGLELEMPSSNGVRDAQIVAAVRGGTLDEAVLDKAVARILNIVFRYADVQHPEAKFDRAAHHALAAELEKECAVLLQNKGALPLARAAKIAYIGGFAEKPRYQGGGSSHINASAVTSALDAARVNGTDVVYAEGFPADRGRDGRSEVCRGGGSGAGCGRGHYFCRPARQLRKRGLRPQPYAFAGMPGQADRACGGGAAQYSGGAAQRKPGGMPVGGERERGAGNVFGRPGRGSGRGRTAVRRCKPQRPTAGDVPVSAGG